MAQKIEPGNFSVTMENRESKVRAFPIGIDTPKVRRIEAGDIERTRQQIAVLVAALQRATRALEIYR